jgi:hypothetical protein
MYLSIKPYATKCGQGKTIIDLFRDFLQKSPMSKLGVLFQLKVSTPIFFITFINISLILSNDNGK